MTHYETYPLFPAPQPHDPVSGRNLGDQKLPTLPQMRLMAERGFRNKAYLTMTRDHEDADQVAEFSDVWLDESGTAPRLMVGIKFNEDDLGVIAQEAVKTRAYDAISAEWKPIKDPATGETTDFMLFGASMTPIPRMNGGTSGCFVVGWPDEEKANSSGYKAPQVEPESTHSTPTNNFGLNMSDTLKASNDAAPMEGVTAPPAKLQTLNESMQQSHPQDTGRGGVAEPTDIKISHGDWQTMQARQAALVQRLEEAETFKTQWQQQKEAEEKRRATELESQRRTKLVASMKTARSYRDQVWKRNQEILAKNGVLKASMEQVDQALETNDIDAFSKINGIEYLIAHMEGDLAVQDQKNKAEQEAQREQERQAKATAAAQAKANQMVAQQLGLLEASVSRAGNISLPAPVSAPAHVAAPMDIATPVLAPPVAPQTAMLQASLDAGMSSSSTSSKQQAMVDAFEAQYGVKRSQVTEVRIKASADVDGLLQSASPTTGMSRGSGRTHERFSTMRYCADMLRNEQIRQMGGQLPYGAAALDVEGVYRASMDAPVGKRAIPFKATMQTAYGPGARISPYYG